MGKPIQVKTAKTPNKAKSDQQKALLKMILGMFGLVLAIILLTNLKQKEVVVVRATGTMMAGDVITDKSMEAYPMLDRVYKELGVREIIDESGKKVTKNVFIPVKQKDQLIGKTVNTYIKAGDIIELSDISLSSVDRNPWISGIKEDQEFYSMKFDASAVNTRLLYPGTQLRARIVMNVSNDVLTDLKDRIKEQAEGEEGKVADAVLTSPDVAKDVSPIMDSSMNEDGTFEIGQSDITGSTPLAEVVIESITVVDMRNSAGESIFDIYSSLVKLPTGERIKYLASTLTSSEESVSFQQRVTPVDITFILDRDGASKLAEFEASSNSMIKYTILPGVSPTAPEACKQLMDQFREVSNQILSISDANEGTTTATPETAETK
ncbi:MAG: hypothetical protein RSC43_00985 [Clostridia bacterium]